MLVLLSGYLEGSNKHEIMDAGYLSCPKPEKMLDPWLKGLKFV